VGSLREANATYEDELTHLSGRVSELQQSLSAAVAAAQQSNDMLQQVKAMAVQETEAAAAILLKAEMVVKKVAMQRQQLIAAATTGSNMSAEQETRLRAQVADLQVGGGSGGLGFRGGLWWFRV
jgi:hypothetical protein